MKSVYDLVNEIIDKFDLKKVDDSFFYLKLPNLCPLDNTPIVLGITIDGNNLVISDNSSTVNKLELNKKVNKSFIQKICAAYHIDFADDTLFIMTTQDRFYYDLNQFIAIILTIFTV